ncbi:MAG: transporter substrate-binding domain-containing protein, partial [Asticcacaulis sp.]
MVRFSQAFGTPPKLRVLTSRFAALLSLTCAVLVAGCQPAAKTPAVEPTGEGGGSEKVSNGPSRSATLKAVRARGKLRCGVNTGQIGFAFPDNRGRWTGFDVDFCRATAAAIFGDPDRVVYVPLASKDRISALKAGRVDVLWRNTSSSFSRDVTEGVDFAGVNYYDGQGFLVRRSLNLTSATELGGARICVLTGSTSALNVQDYFTANALNYDPVPVQTEAQAREAYAQERCDALTSDIAELAAVRSTLEGPQGH